MKFGKNEKELFFTLYKRDCVASHDASAKLWQKIRKYRFLLNSLPFVREVAVCNSLSFNITNDQSDIDLFFILDSRRFYTSRILITLLFHVFGVRRHSHKIAGRFCLSFYISDKRMGFDSFTIDDDLLLYYWFYHLFFLRDNLMIQKAFLNANRCWFAESPFVFKSKSFSTPNFCCKLMEFIVGLGLFDKLEILLKNWQIRRATIKYEKLGKPFGIVIEDGIFKFHYSGPPDPRIEYSEKLKAERSSW